MAFRLKKIVGTGVSQSVFTNGLTDEAVIHSMVVYNNSGTAGDFSLTVAGENVLVETIEPSGVFRLTDKVNIEPSVAVTITATGGFEIMVSYLQQTVDASGALTLAQQAASDAATSALQAENALPAGTIDDNSVAADKAWSAQKIKTDTDLIRALALAGI